MRILGSVLNNWKNLTGHLGPQMMPLGITGVSYYGASYPGTLEHSPVICSVQLGLLHTASGLTQPSEYTSIHHWPQQLRKWTG